MGQLKNRKHALRPPRLDRHTDIQAPSVRAERVNGKVKYTLTPPRAGIITILSDDEDEREPKPRPEAIKRESSHKLPRETRQGHQSSSPGSRPRVKRDSTSSWHGGQEIQGPNSSVPPATDARRTQNQGPLRRNEAHGGPSPPDDSTPPSESGSESSDSSESKEESYSSSHSSSSDGSSSGDETGRSLYRPSTPASSIGSSTPQTRRKTHAGTQATSPNPKNGSPSRRSVQNEESTASGHAPLDFFIDLPARPIRGRPDMAARSRSHTSPAVVPTAVQADHCARSNHHRPNNSSPVLLGFMPINRGLPPGNAPTEPRAMRTADVFTNGTSVQAPHQSSISSNSPLPSSSSLPFRGLPPTRNKTQQKTQQRRGPARPGRIMQTVEHPSVVNSAGAGRPLNHGSSSLPLSPVTPLSSSRRTAPPQLSPGVLMTPPSGSFRPLPTSEARDALQSASPSRSRRKRRLEETDDAESTSKAAEWKRMLERMEIHEKEMEQQRAQLEEAKRLVAEQSARIDDLEQQRRVEELVRDLDVQTRAEERAVAPPLDAATPDVPLQHGSHHQSERRQARRHRNASREARALLQEQERQEQDSQRLERQRLGRQRLEQQRQEELELEQQMEQEQRREAERQEQRRQRVMRRLQNEPQRAPAQRQPQIRTQAQIQHQIFTHPLSGHNPKLVFDDDDRPTISEATAFLMRLPQSFILGKMRQLMSGRAFFDVAHPSSAAMGCWVVSRRASADLRMRLCDSGELHNFSFARLAVRLWHDEQSIYSLLQHKHHQKAVHTCLVEECMRPDHIVVEPSAAAGERRRCKRQGRCRGHVTVHKDGTRQRRRPCIFPPQGAYMRP
ncbi:hypothetical protein N8I77_003150 [Diaporthe amygdali]|uniref:Zinc-binding loop region of homing endonuclease domain-containing protein n=1 Tax=Phomopsis amygdali TaxID=1214568 RepID=A0AAD9SI75_PHOAM|nr:hypothetical protein N8I77_003150 [Diaporthe amygdali]